MKLSLFRYTIRMARRRKK